MIGIGQYNAGYRTFDILCIAADPIASLLGGEEAGQRFGMTLETSTIASDAPLFLSRIWAPTLLIAGFGLTLAWTALLGYELIELVGMAL